jgi:hypothetical protein
VCLYRSKDTDTKVQKVSYQQRVEAVRVPESSKKATNPSWLQDKFKAAVSMQQMPTLSIHVRGRSAIKEGSKDNLNTLDGL